ncbi:peptidoglycan binding domain-containing protein [Streptomyces sp. NPDC006512]|uniref:peptidoglycan binding domain-containing protein n=1 Tax=Streptomyces sp. NPDC006512 TaxID=3154307 RepID=UPI0033ACB422
MRRARRTETREATGKRWTAPKAAGVTGGAAVLAFGGLYAAGLLLAGEEVAPGTKVRGVDIGGMTRAEARRALARDLGPSATAPLGLRIGERTERAAPATLGLSLDTAATVDRAARAGSGPFTVIGRLFAAGDPDVRPVVRFDEKAARAALDGLGKKTGQGAREGSVTFEKGKAKATAPAAGIALDADRSLDVLRAAYPRPAGSADPVELPVRRTEPRVGQQETERALKEFGEPAVSAPVTLTVEGKRVPVAPAVLGRHLSMKDDGKGRLVPVLDEKALLADPAVGGPLRQASPGRSRRSCGSTAPARSRSPRTAARAARSPPGPWARPCCRCSPAAARRPARARSPPRRSSPGSPARPSRGSASRRRCPRSPCRSSGPRTGRRT